MHVLEWIEEEEEEEEGGGSRSMHVEECIEVENKGSRSACVSARRGRWGGIEEMEGRMECYQEVPLIKY